MPTTYSFNGATFHFRGSGGRTFPTWDKKELITVKDRPNESAMQQDIGEDIQRAALVIRCTKAELIALYDQVLQSGSLIFPWETHDAFLESMDSASLVVTGNDRYEATLHVIRL
jgi:hypothetical protein